MTLVDHGLTLDAKLDTGADNSSLHATAIERLRIAGRPHVRFSIASGTGPPRLITAAVVRTVRIRRSGGDGDSRPVVRMKLCLAGRTIETEVNLTDRADLSYPLLVGRSALAGLGLLIDSSGERVAPAGCAR